MKGGKLARLMSPARVLSLIVSDIVADPMDMIASGPTVITEPQENSRSPLDILDLYNLTDKIPQHVRAVLAATPDQGCGAEPDIVNILIGTNDIPLQHARRLTSAHCHSLLLTRSLTGEAREVGRHFASLVKSICCQDGQCLDESAKKLKLDQDVMNNINEKWQAGRPLVLLAGGETTVKVVGNGVGGRNQELVLSFAIEISPDQRRIRDWGYRVEFLSCGTDGIDGPTDSAGAVWSSDLSLDRQLASRALEDNDSHRFWRQNHPGCLVVTGHTGTNVADIIICKIQRNDDSE